MIKKDKIDAFLKKHYLGCPVAIRIQRKEETFLDALLLLKSAADKKGCSYGILITHERNWSDNKVPDNIIVLNRYNVQFETELEKRMNY